MKMISLRWLKLFKRKNFPLEITFQDLLLLTLWEKEIMNQLSFFFVISAWEIPFQWLKIQKRYSLLNVMRRIVLQNTIQVTTLPEVFMEKFGCGINLLDQQNKILWELVTKLRIGRKNAFLFTSEIILGIRDYSTVSFHF